MNPCVYFWEQLARSPDPTLPTDVVRGSVGVSGYYAAVACWLAGALWPKEKVGQEYTQ